MKAQYQLKPKVYEADQFTAHKTPWPDGVYSKSSDDGCQEQYFVNTDEGKVKINTNDWVVTPRDSLGKEVYGPVVFAQTFMRVG